MNIALVDGRKSRRNILRSFLKELDPSVQVVALENSDQLFNILSTHSFEILVVHKNTTPESGIGIARRIKEMKILIYGDGRINTIDLGASFICTDGNTTIFADSFCAEADKLMRSC
jgi:DNA-binding NarL/FixJ family response regulator